MDGLDLALVRLTGAGDRPAIELVAATTRPYAAALTARLQAARGCAGSPHLHTELADLWASDVRALLAAARVSPAEVAVLGSHGQTLFHRPRADGEPAATLQVGDGARLARATGIPVVSDFRQADIEAGGEGAPLVPMAEWILHGGGGVSASQNLGSIANVAVLTPDPADILAFDTGPANMLIDAFARRIDGDIDRDGRLSAQGRVDDEVLLELYVRRAAWLATPPPRSAGYGTFGPELIDAVLAAQPAAEPHDLVRTAVEFTAKTLREAYERFVLTRFPELVRVRMSGGGTRNPTLMRCLRAELEPLGLEVEVLEDRWRDAAEAVAFALLADRTWRGLPGNVPAATGARRSVVLGRLDMPSAGSEPDGRAIRLARPEDAEGITRCHVGGWKVHYRGILSDALLDAISFEERLVSRRERLEAQPVVGQVDWVIEEGGAIVGWAATGPARDADLPPGTHELFAIYMDPERVGQGYGRALMEHCLAEARGAGHAEMVMWVLTGNARARRFYAAAGFLADPRVPEEPFREEGVLKLRMTRRL